MAIQIGNQGTVTISTNVTADSAKQTIPSTSTFNFTFNQEWVNPNVTVSSIGGFTSTPSFTPTSNAFTFNSTGTPTGTITFSFTMTSGNISANIQAELIQNSVLLESKNETITNGNTIVFTPILVSENDTIQIRTLPPD